MTASELLRFVIDPKRRIIAQIKQYVPFNIDILEVDNKIITISYRKYLKKINILVMGVDDIINILCNEIYLYLQLLDRYPNMIARYQKYIIKSEPNLIYYVVISNDTYILYGKTNNLEYEIKNTKNIDDILGI